MTLSKKFAAVVQFHVKVRPLTVFLTLRVSLAFSSPKGFFALYQTISALFSFFAWDV